MHWSMEESSLSSVSLCRYSKKFSWILLLRSNSLKIHQKLSFRNVNRCTAIHNQWILLASASVKSWISSAMHCIQLFDYSRNTIWVRELRSICEESKLNWCFLLWILFSYKILRHKSFKGVINNQFIMLPILNFKFLLAFLPIIIFLNDHPKVNALLISCSSK